MNATFFLNSVLYLLRCIQLNRLLKCELVITKPEDVVVELVVTGHRYHRTEGDADGVKDLSSSIDPHLQHKRHASTGFDFGPLSI